MKKQELIDRLLSGGDVYLHRSFHEHFYTLTSFSTTRLNLSSIEAAIKVVKQTHQVKYRRVDYGVWKLVLIPIAKGEQS